MTQVQQVVKPTKTLDQIVGDDRVHVEPLEQKNRFLGISFIIIEIGVMVAYGLSGNYYIQPDFAKAAFQQIFANVIMFLFVLVGFGLLLSTYKLGNWLGLTTSIVIVAVSVQFGPLLQKFWFSIFLTGFGSTNGAQQISLNAKQYYQHFSNSVIQASSYMNRVSLLTCISLLVVNTAVIGRLNMAQIMKMTSLYHMFWNLNYGLLLYLCIIYRDHSNEQSTSLHNPKFFDVYGTTFNYIFAAGFGLVISITSAKTRIPSIHPRNQISKTSVVMASVGTAFIFATFMLTGNNVIKRPTPNGMYLQHFTIFWGLTGSVIGTYMGSLLAGKGVVGYKEALVGTITGGIIMGHGGTTITSIGLCIMIGCIAGFISGVYMRLIHPFINKNSIHDYLGLFGPFFITALLGGLVVTPAAIIYYPNNDKINQSIGNYNYKLAGWQLVYVGISFGIGIGSGLIVALLGCCDKQYFGLASNSRIYQNNFGLYTPQQLQQQYVAPIVVNTNRQNQYTYNSQSASHLNQNGL